MPDDDKELVLGLATRLREVVLPYLGAHAGRAQHTGGAGGDVTFAIDEIAERALESFIAEHAPHVAYYSEDRGLVSPSHDHDHDHDHDGGGDGIPPGDQLRTPTHVLIVDPIDGTRPAMAGLESACTCVALAPLGPDNDPRLRDVTHAAVVEIKTGDWFAALRGGGPGGVTSSLDIRLSPTTSTGEMFWGYGFRGRPARPSVEVLAELIDASSVGGGTFELGSQAYVMTRIATGQLDAVVEVGSRLVDDVPGMREQFERVGRGHVLNNSPYDIAAPWLILSEAGGVVTDGWGRPIDDYRLLGSGHEFQISSISAANATLHERLLTAVDAGIDRLRRTATAHR